MPTATVTGFVGFMSLSANRQGIGRNAGFIRWDAEQNYCCAPKVLPLSGIPPFV